MMICPCVTTNAHLREWIRQRGTSGACAQCGTVKRHAVGATQFAKHVDSVIRRHYLPDDHGESAKALIQEVAGVNPEIAGRVTKIVDGSDYPGPAFYDHYLSRVRHLPLDHLNTWTHFVQSVKHDARFFGAESRAALDEFLCDVKTFCEGIAIRKLTATDSVFRARLASSSEEARKWFQEPAKELAAPPQELARSSRMNAEGIRVFYGALKEEIAVAEVRPQVNSRVVVGSFTPTRPLEVLDLGALGGLDDCVDLFDPEFDVMSKRLQFLRILDDLLSRPIQLHDESLDYIPTQVFAEYVRIALGLDGVLYRSAQTGEAPEPGQLHGPVLEPRDRNVVLFGTAALATSDGLAEGSEPGLEFCPDSQQLLNVTRLEISYVQNIGAHYEPPPSDS